MFLLVRKRANSPMICRFTIIANSSTHKSPFITNFKGTQTPKITLCLYEKCYLIRNISDLFHFPSNFALTQFDRNEHASEAGVTKKLLRMTKELTSKLGS